MIHQDEIDKLVARYIEQEGVLIEDTPPTAEQRQDQRFAAFDQDAYLYCGLEYAVRIRDISLSGIRIANAPEGISVGAPVRIVATLGTYGVLATTCEVVHVFEMGGVRYAGLKFQPEHHDELAPLTSYFDASE